MPASPSDLWNLVKAQLYALAEDAAGRLVPALPPPTPEPSAAGTILADRLLVPFDTLPPGNALVSLVREILGDFGTGSPVRVHGWRRTQAGPFGIALVLTDAAGRAVLAVTPGGPVFDFVVVPSAALTADVSTGPWRASATIAAPDGWDVAFGPGQTPGPPRGSAGVTLERTGRLGAGLDNGPGLSVDGVSITVNVGSGVVPSADLQLRNLTVAALPKDLAGLLGIAAGNPLRGVQISPAIRVDQAGGLRFTDTGTVRLDLPLRLDGPGIQTRGVGLELRAGAGGPRLGVSVSLAADLPGLPLRAELDGAGFDLPATLSSDRLFDQVGELFPDGIEVALMLAPVSGGGLVRRTADGGYGGLIAIDLGFVALQAAALLGPPAGGAPTTFLVALAARFPAPGLELGFGFALDGVGGLVGVNRRVDDEALRRLVCEGHADRVLFPDHVLDRADEVIAALGSAFPIAPGRFLIGPMLQISWLDRMVSLSAALVLELPAPARAVLIGRLLVALPDPAVPLVRLQASILGRVDPGVPVVELLASLAGSWIVGLSVSGEVYLLVRGGDQAVFVLSAGGFHPRYIRPAGVPALRRLALDLAPGGSWGLRFDAYLAVTSNAVMFGGQVQLEAMIAGCGVEGWLGLDALFVFDPTFGFSVHVYAGVAVRAFGHRLCGVGLDFTLEGPAPWHAFGTGSISVLFWDISLDFDIGWGSPPAVGSRPAGDPADPVRQAIGSTKAWAVQQPVADRTALEFTADAKQRLAADTVVHPDARLRVSQTVLPLGTPIRRFQGRPIAEQTWTITAVTLGSPRPIDPAVQLTELFIPGDFFALTEDQKLTVPAFEPHPSGASVGLDGASVGPGHRVDDSYETDYEPARAAHAREFRPWPGHFNLEAALVTSVAERIERWRRPAAVFVRAATPAPPAAVLAQFDLAAAAEPVEAWELPR
jgi:hypothetical protein